MLTQEQLAQRLEGIGSSDIPAIADLHPTSWKNRRGPEDVLKEKLGLVPPFEGNARTRKGDRLEPHIAQWWSEDNKRPVRRNTATVAHPTIPWALATVDFFTDDAEGDLVECKYVGLFVGKTWKDAPPGYVFAQVQWQLGVLAKKRAFVAAMIEGCDDLVRSFLVEFDPEFFEQLLFIAKRFQDRVQTARAELAKEKA